MQSFPSRCQHIKVNGTLCGSPALRRNRFCYFHKRAHEERIRLSADRARRRPAVLNLPVLEDANSIQVALMQIMRLLALGQLDSKTAGLMLYALQTASSNLRHTHFEPHRHDVVLDPRKVGQVPLESNIWEDEDFMTEAEQEEEDEAEALAEAQRKLEKQRKLERWAMAEARRLANSRNRSPEDDEEPRVAKTPQPTPAQGARRPPANVDLNQVREQVRQIARDTICALPKETIHAMEAKLNTKETNPAERT